MENYELGKSYYLPVKVTIDDPGTMYGVAISFHTNSSDWLSTVWIADEPCLLLKAEDICANDACERLMELDKVNHKQADMIISLQKENDELTEEVGRLKEKLDNICEVRRKETVTHLGKLKEKDLVISLLAAKALELEKND